MHLYSSEFLWKILDTLFNIFGFALQKIQA